MSIFEQPIVVSAVCNEPEGDVVRNVRFMPLSADNLAQFYQKSHHFKTLFAEELNGDFNKFLNLFLKQGVNGIETNGLFWVIDDFVGMYYVTDIVAGVDAKVHYTFFDRRHKGRHALTRAMIKYAFEQFSFERLTVEIPLYATSYAFNFIERVGFTKEGRKRSAARYRNTMFDVNCYGILKDEVLNGNAAEAVR